MIINDFPVILKGIDPVGRELDWKLLLAYHASKRGYSTMQSNFVVHNTCICGKNYE